MTGPGDRVETMVPRLLLSARTRDALADAIAAARGGQALDILTLEDAADDPAAQVHAAYLSRNVTKLSTKHVVLEPLAGFYRMLQRSPDLH